MTTAIPQESVDDIVLFMELTFFTPVQRQDVLDAINSGSTLKEVMSLGKPYRRIIAIHLQEDPEGLY